MNRADFLKTVPAVGAVSAVSFVDLPYDHSDLLHRVVERMRPDAFFKQLVAEGLVHETCPGIWTKGMHWRTGSESMVWTAGRGWLPDEDVKYGWNYTHRDIRAIPIDRCEHRTIWGRELYISEMRGKWLVMTGLQSVDCEMIEKHSDYEGLNWVYIGKFESYTDHGDCGREYKLSSALRFHSILCDEHMTLNERREWVYKMAHEGWNYETTTMGECLGDISVTYTHGNVFVCPDEVGQYYSSL